MAGIVSALARPSGLLVLASALLAGAIMDTAGFFGPGALAMASAAAAIALVASRRARQDAARPTGLPSQGAEDGMGRLLGLMVALFLGYDLVKLGRSVPALVLLAAGCLLLALDWRASGEEGRVGDGAFRRGRLWLWLACAVALLVLDLRARDGSSIDVWTFQQEASAALLRGENPYSIAYRNIYGDMRFYGPEVADATRVRAFPYPPQTVLADLPAFALLGDVRFTMLAALLVAGWAMSRLAQASVANLAAAAVVFHPGVVRVLRSAWTEPAVLAPLLLLLLAIRRFSVAPPRGWLAVGAAGALTAGAKQYSPLLLAPLIAALPGRGRVRAVALAAALAAAVTVPFAVWDPSGLWDGVVAMQLRQPFRADSLSWPAALARLGLGPAPAAVSLLLATAVLAACWPRGRSLAQAVTCGAAAFLVFLLAAKQAFLNYYWLADGLLLAAALLQHAEERGRTAGEPLR